MLTPLTQTALAVLNGISCGETSPHPVPYAQLPNALPDILAKLEAYGLIASSVNCASPPAVCYTLTRPAYHITLLNVLEALDEHLNCNHEADEDLYLRNGTVARKLGVINQITRQYLSEIKLTDL